MKIKSYSGEYEAEFYSDFSFFYKITEIHNKFFIVDKNVFSLYNNEIELLIGDSPFFLLESIEENKNVEEALNIITNMVDIPSKRNTVLVAIGGGIVQDVSAFIANILYRGISWILIPTTLLSQTDSCIGSKTSLNFKHYKNLLGYFYPPTQIYINTQFIHTLPQKEYYSGLGEIMKCALMAGYQSFCDTYNNFDALSNRKDNVLIREMMKALEFKKKIIEIDEFDKEYRNIMNYGHTFGHALESASDYAIPHGQGVSFGMMIANEISAARNYITEERKQEVNSAIAHFVDMSLLKKEYVRPEIYLSALKKDKKFLGTAHNCILWSETGVKKYSDISDAEIIAACKNLFME